MKDEAFDAVVSTGVAACREARAELEGVADGLAEAAPPLERKARFAIGALAVADGAPAERVAHALSTAVDALTELLGELQAAEDDGLAGSTAGVARTLATLYPMRRALSSALPAEEPEPVPLARPKKKKTLQLVPDADVAAERRQAPRVELDVDIGLHSETNFFAGFGDDISEGGLFVATYDLLPVGTELTLSFVLPFGPQLTLVGRVAWLREPAALESDLAPGMGVAFGDLDAASAEAIRRYMEKRAPMFYDAG